MISYRCPLELAKNSIQLVDGDVEGETSLKVLLDLAL
jgi:hypothetical protein